MCYAVFFQDLWRKLGYLSNKIGEGSLNYHNSNKQIQALVLSKVWQVVWQRGIPVCY